MASGVFNLYCQDTTPGANSTFAPARGWEGDDEDYLKLMRYRYARDTQIRQQMDVLVHRISRARQTSQKVEVIYSGPFATQAQQIIQRLVEENRKYTVVTAPAKARSAKK
jgi:hypothetical protein